MKDKIINLLIFPLLHTMREGHNIKFNFVKNRGKISFLNLFLKIPIADHFIEKVL